MYTHYRSSIICRRHVSPGDSGRTMACRLLRAREGQGLPFQSQRPTKVRPRTDPPRKNEGRFKRLPCHVSLAKLGRSRSHVSHREQAAECIRKLGETSICKHIQTTSDSTSLTCK